MIYIRSGTIIQGCRVQFVRLLPPNFSIIIQFMFTISYSGLRFSTFSFGGGGVTTTGNNGALQFVFRVRFSFNIVRSHSYLFGTFMGSLTICKLIGGSHRTRVRYLIRVVVMNNCMGRGCIKVFLWGLLTRIGTICLQRFSVGGDGVGLHITFRGFISILNYRGTMQGPIFNGVLTCVPLGVICVFTVIITGDCACRVGRSSLYKFFFPVWAGGTTGLWL